MQSLQPSRQSPDGERTDRQFVPNSRGAAALTMKRCKEPIGYKKAAMSGLIYRSALSRPHGANGSAARQEFAPDHVVAAARQEADAASARSTRLEGDRMT